jgi:hypothetical protein
MSKIRELKNKLIAKAIESSPSSRFFSDAKDIAEAVLLLTQAEAVEAESGLYDDEEQ